MEKRVFVAIFLSFLILAVYQAYFAPPTPSAGDGGARGCDARRRDQASVRRRTAQTRRRARRRPPFRPTSRPPAAPVIADATARDIVVDTDQVHAVFSTAGAVLKSWRLKHFFAISNKGAMTRDPLDLVPSELPPTFDVGAPGAPKIVTLDRPFTLGTDDAAMSATLSHALPGRASIGCRSGPRLARSVSSITTVAGLGARKTLSTSSPTAHPYVIGVDVAVDVAGTARPAVTIDWGPSLGSTADTTSRTDRAGYQPTAGLQWRNDKVERLSAKTLVTAPSYDDTFLYAGVNDHYFPERRDAGPASAIRRSRTQPPTLPVPLDLDPQNRTRDFVAYRVRVPEAASLTFFRRAQGFRRPAFRRSGARARDRFRHVRRDRRPTAPGAQGDQSLRPQLRLVDRRADDSHQRRALPVAAPQHGVDAQDAGAPARGEGDSASASPNTKSPIPSARR